MVEERQIPDKKAWEGAARFMEDAVRAQLEVCYRNSAVSMMLDPANSIGMVKGCKFSSVKVAVGRGCWKREVSKEQVLMVQI